MIVITIYYKYTKCVNSCQILLKKKSKIPFSHASSNGKSQKSQSTFNTVLLRSFFCGLCKEF